MCRFPLIAICVIALSSMGSTQNIELPSDYSIDLDLANVSRSRMMNGAQEVVDPEQTASARDVFQRLVATGSFIQPYNWKLTVVQNTVTNASSTAGGQVYLYGGLWKMIGNSPGLLAATLSHEVSHTALRHQVRVYLLQLYQERMRAYYRYRAASGDKNANWALVGFNIGAPIAL